MASVSSAITGTPNLSSNPTAYSNPGALPASQSLSPAIQTLWSKEILFQSMPILRYEQFAIKKTELGVAPGLQINFMRYNNLGAASQLVEGVRMVTNALSASQFSITVAEHGFAVAVSELLLNASFDDIMSSASRLLGRNMAVYLDTSARDTLLQASSILYGYQMSGTPATWYDHGTVGTSRASMTGNYFFSPAVIKDAVESLATKNIPRLGDTYVCFVHPHQSRSLRDTPEFIEVTKYAAPGNLMIGEIGRLNDVVFIETTQTKTVANGAGANYTNDTANSGLPNGSNTRYTATFIGDNAFGHAISLPVELRDGGILDFGREHALAWYAVWGLGLITDQSIILAETN